MVGGKEHKSYLRPSDEAKKLIESALLEIAQAGQTTDPRLIAVIRAKEINRYLGAAAVFPWTVYDLPEDWLDVFDGLENDLPGMEEAQKQVEAIKEQWRSKFEKKY